ncbi:hypothetical protein [Streptomyces longisporoflavus]|uniref:Uncharacterized protein n=1 Tax=Streptomyces longisporoflavus TaxID=28044 RepID=A0ABW7R0F1_9ACTN
MSTADPFGWTPEVAHQLGHADHLIADALMHYTPARTDSGRTKLRALVEVDRFTTVRRPGHHLPGRRLA